MIPLAREIIEELEEAGDRRVFMARGDYDRAIRALSRCDHAAAQVYLEKVLAIGEPSIPIAGLVSALIISITRALGNHRNLIKSDLVRRVFLRLPGELARCHVVYCSA